MSVAKKFKTTLKSFKQLLDDFISQISSSDELRHALVFRLNRIPA